MEKTRNLLVISQNSVGLNNNGKAIKAIISKYEFSNIRQIYFYNEIPQSSNFESFYRITDLDILKVYFPFKAAKKIGIHLNSNNLKSNEIIDYSRNNLFNSFKSILKSPLSSLLRDLYWSKLDWDKYIRPWIDTNTPDDVFYIMSDGLFSLKLIISIAEFYKLKPLVFVTDDYLIINPEDSMFSKLKKKLLIKKFIKLINLESKFLFLSRNLKYHYENEFNLNNSELFFLDFSKKINFSVQIINETTDIMIFNYSGNLSLGRDRMLIDFALIVFKLSPSSVIRITSLEKPSGFFKKSILKFPNIEFLGAHSPEENNKLLRFSNFLIHVESFIPKHKNITRYSISSKIYEYITLGIPIIGFGPEEIESMKYIHENEIGIVCSNSAELLTELEKLMNDKLKQDDIKMKQRLLYQKNTDINSKGKFDAKF